MQQVIQQTRGQDVLIYSIGIGDPNAGTTLSLGPFILGQGGDTERVDADTLRTLSAETGAKSLIIGEIGDGENLRKALNEISSELTSQYTVGFVWPNSQQQVKYQNLRLELPNRQDARVQVPCKCVVAP